MKIEISLSFKCYGIKFKLIGVALIMIAQKLVLPSDHHERLHYVKRSFSIANNASFSGAKSSQDLRLSWRGGRSEALAKMHSINAVAYNKNRNFLNGAVTRLSPYLRHGCLTLNEAFDFAKAKFGQDAEKLLFEFAWRDYWRQVWYAEGDAIFSEMEPPKVAISHAPLSDAVMQGKTGLPCMDGFIQELLMYGYVHNHARMWLASYIVHHLKIDWRAAADWFEAHLLDGDIASNHLSWQWVTSTFSSKPYFFNKENLSRYTGEKYCVSCKVECPFDASYEVLNERLFNKTLVPIAKQYSITSLPKMSPSVHSASAVFVHDAMLSPANPILKQPFPKFFVFDPQIHGAFSLNRLQFIADCLAEIPSVEVWIGATYDVLTQRGVGRITTQNIPNLKIKALLEPFSPVWEREPKFVDVEISSKRLKRFSRYWEKVGPLVLGDANYRKP